MAEFTKGPWRLNSDAQGPCMVMHPTLKGVAIANLQSVFLPSNDFHDPTDETSVPCAEAINGVTFHSERVANARLIAAAPDLLAALEGLLGAVHDASWRPRNEQGPILKEPRSKARAAIAAARGINGEVR